jgi:hypothetical protein
VDPVPTLTSNDHHITPLPAKEAFPAVTVTILSPRPSNILCLPTPTTLQFAYRNTTTVTLTLCNSLPFAHPVFKSKLKAKKLFIFIHNFCLAVCFIKHLSYLFAAHTMTTTSETSKTLHLYTYCTLQKQIHLQLSHLSTNIIFSPSAPQKPFDTLTMLDSTASSHLTLSTSITTLVTHSTLPDYARIQPNPMLDAPAQPKLEVPASVLITTLMATYPDLPDSGSLQPNSVLEAPAQTTLYGTGTSQRAPD